MNETFQSSSSSALLELVDVQKSFGAVRALRSASLRVDAGSIHALVGENGAGKSTLVKIVSGVHRRDAGVFRFQGSDVDFGSTAESKAAGIAVIYQEPTLFPDLSVTENIFMGRQPLRSGRRIDRRAMETEAEALFARLGVRLDPARPARGLSIADQQIIEIAKAISLDASLLVMDEPTAALSGVEVERLFAVARSLRDEGRGLVFVSHRFDEIFALCDQVTVFRDGDYVSTEAIKDTTVDALVAKMVGPRGGRAVPEDAGPGRRRRARRAGARVGGHLPRRLLLGGAGARSWPWPGSSARGAARSPARSSAWTATTPDGSPSWASGCPATTRAPPCAPGWPSSPRTDGSRGWSPRSRWRATSPPSSGEVSPRPASSRAVRRPAPADPGPPGSR